MKFNLIENDEFPNYDFFFKCMKEQTYLKATKENIELADDWFIIWKPNSKFQMFGLWMWSNKLQKIRETSQSEFYGKGIVD